MKLGFATVARTSRPCGPAPRCVASGMFSKIGYGAASHADGLTGLTAAHSQSPHARMDFSAFGNCPVRRN